MTADLRRVLDAFRCPLCGDDIGGHDYYPWKDASCENTIPDLDALALQAVLDRAAAAAAREGERRVGRVIALLSDYAAHGSIDEAVVFEAVRAAAGGGEGA